MDWLLRSHPKPKRVSMRPGCTGAPVLINIILNGWFKETRLRRDQERHPSLVLLWCYPEMSRISGILAVSDDFAEVNPVPWIFGFLFILRIQERERHISHSFQKKNPQGFIKTRNWEKDSSLIFIPTKESSRVYKHKESRERLISSIHSNKRILKGL